MPTPKTFTKLLIVLGSLSLLAVYVAYRARHPKHPPLSNSSKIGTALEVYDVKR